MLSLLKLLFVVLYIFKISGEFTAAGIWIGYLPLYLIQFFSQTTIFSSSPSLTLPWRHEWHCQKKPSSLLNGNRTFERILVNDEQLTNWGYLSRGKLLFLLAWVAYRFSRNLTFCIHKLSKSIVSFSDVSSFIFLLQLY